MIFTDEKNFVFLSLTVIQNVGLKRMRLNFIEIKQNSAEVKLWYCSVPEYTYN